MFCQNCGKEVSEDVKFCPSCGKPVNQLEVKKETTLSTNCSNELKSYYDYFSPISEVYKLSNIGTNLLNDSRWYKRVNGRLIGGIIMFVLSIVGFIFTLVSILNEPILGFFLWEFFVAELVVFVFGVVYMILYGKHKHTLNFYKKNLPRYNQKIVEHYNQCENCSLPIAYSDPAIIQQLISLLDSKRADNLKEAINLFEDERHKAEIRSELKVTKEAAKEAAFAASISAINSF